MAQRFARRHCLKLLAATAFSGLPRLGRAQGDAGTLTVASLGGEWEARERKAVFEPFEKATGVRVTVVAYRARRRSSRSREPGTSSGTPSSLPKARCSPW